MTPMMRWKLHENSKKNKVNHHKNDIFPKKVSNHNFPQETPLPRTPGTPGTTPWPSVEGSSVQVESKVLLDRTLLCQCDAGAR